MPRRHQPGKYFHRAVESGGVIYLSGMVASDLTAGMKAQTLSCLGKVAASLEELGSDKSRILMATAYITDMGQKDAMNEAWVEFFAPGELPARATIGVASLGPGVLVEVVCTAEHG